MKPASIEDIADAPAIRVSDYDDAMFVLRDRMIAGLQPESGHNGQFFTQVIKNSVIDLWGQDHFERKKLLGTIFNPVRLLEIEQRSIVPGVLEPLRKLRDRVRKKNDFPKGDLIRIARRTATRMTAEIIGLAGLNNDEALDEFEIDFRSVERGMRAKFVARTAAAAITADALSARDRLLAKYFRPIWNARAPLVEKIKHEGIDASTLPDDLISLMLLNPEHFDKHAGSREGELTVFMVASIGSSTNSICGAVLDLLTWVKDHPEDNAKLTDPGFLERAVQESARVHQTTDLFRTVMHDIRLPSGQFISRGTVIIIDRAALNETLTAQANAIPQDSFNPYRTMSNQVPQYALSFGAGAHACVGRGLMLGQSKTKSTDRRRSGFSVQFLLSVFAAGVEFDPGADVKIDPLMARRETFSEFPVQFTALDTFEDTLRAANADT